MSAEAYDYEVERPPSVRALSLVPDVDEDQADLERETAQPGAWGEPVDVEAEPVVTLYGTVTDRAREERRPIVPAWLRNAEQRAAFLRETARFLGYLVVFHLVRVPKYVGLALVFAPWGVLRVAGRQLRWWWHPELTSLMQYAATRNDLKEGQSVHKQLGQARQSRGLWLVFETVAVAGVVGAVVLFVAPLWQALFVAVLVPVFARVGRPVGRPITDRVYSGPRFTRLHAEMVRVALCSIGIAGIKEPSSVTFPVPIHRDGPGWLARVNLPAGVEAVKVLESRGALSSALRLPVDQVWPSAGPDHAGQVDLWVGYLPASKMGQPRWSLLDENARTSVFEPAEFGTDQRQRAVTTRLFERNFLIGGVPGSGKSYAARTLAMIAALDPTCEMKIVELKGTGDFLDLEHLCSTYVVGVDDQAIEAAADVIAWGLGEAERRGERIRKFKAQGLAPEGKVTPELAARPGSGLHPVFILIDEGHELFPYSKEVQAAAERLIKRGRALGIIVVLATQIPDAKSVPPNITRCVTVRWCLAVQDQLSNDMILGTGAYKRGLSAAVYRPGVDAGWGIAIGLEQAGPVRSHFPTPEQNKALVDRATVLRGGGVVGSADYRPRRRDLVMDLREVFARTKARRLHRQQLLDYLVEFWPETYSGWTADMLGEAMREAGIPVVDVKVNGITAKGVKVEAITAAIDAREVAAR